MLLLHVVFKLLCDKRAISWYGDGVGSLGLGSWVKCSKLGEAKGNSWPIGHEISS